MPFHCHYREAARSFPRWWSEILFKKNKIKNIHNYISCWWCLAAAAAAAADLVPNDANGDGTVNINDIILVVGFVTGSSTLDDCIVENVDVDGNGIIDVSDVILYVNIIIA